MHNLTTVILAAGKGTRMKSELPKVLVPLKNKPMIHYVINTAIKINSKKIIIVVGHKKELVIENIKNHYPQNHYPNISIDFVTQEPQLGTGHAIIQTLPFLNKISNEHVLILSGDVPMISSKTLDEMIYQHFQTMSLATIMTSITKNPTGYGRIVRKNGSNFQNIGQVEEIVEEKDITEKSIKDINEINCGIYLFESSILHITLPQLNNNNAQNEYYLTDIIKTINEINTTTEIYQARNFYETLGINTIEQLNTFL